MLFYLSLRPPRPTQACHCLTISSRVMEIPKMFSIQANLKSRKVQYLVSYFFTLHPLSWKLNGALLQLICYSQSLTWKHWFQLVSHRVWRLTRLMAELISIPEDTFLLSRSTHQPEQNFSYIQLPTYFYFIFHWCSIASRVASSQLL